MENETYPVHKVINFTNEQWALIRAFRFAQQINTETATVRILIDLGLKAHANKEPN